MHKLTSAIIDASVLAVPISECSKNDVFQYVETLLDWSKLLNEPWVSVFMSERASETLIDARLFPLRDHLKELFANHGVFEYSVNDIAIVAEKLLTLTPSFEAYYQIDDVLIEQIETKPEVIQLIENDGLMANLARCITLIAVLSTHCSKPFGGDLLILKKTPSKLIQVRVQIHDLEHNRDDIPPLPDPPNFFEGEVLACDDLQGLIKCFDESAILVYATDDFGIGIAIRIALFKYAISQGDTPVWSEITAPAIGPKFRQLCQKICADQGDSLPPKILRAIVESMNKNNLQAVHALRRGIAGGDAPQTRGADKAQRRDIDKTFHLHYWETESGSIELASVVHHNDYSIPY